MAFIYSEKLEFEYITQETSFKALDNVNLDIKKGEFLSIIGHNGSGKSTIAKHFNAILTPTRGSIWINNINSKNEEEIWDIRKSVGMVFQNPDNQIVATTVESDIAFGLENLGLEPSEIRSRVDSSLNKLNMLNYKKDLPSNLSGGQKQKIAIAGIIAMKPECIVFDEATSMLDPLARDEVIKIMLDLNKKHNITIILITHHMEEVVFSDRVIVMEKGKVVLEDTPKNLFSKYEELKSLKLDLPQITKLSYILNKHGFNIKSNCLDTNEFISEIERIGFKEEILPIKQDVLNKNTEDIINIKNLDCTYFEGTVFQKKALENINLDIKKGEIIGIIGHTGSGKSTLVQHLNMLIKPEDNKIFFYDKNVNELKSKEIRQKIGLVFQYPESQIFEETIFKEVAFAPKNMELSEEEIYNRVKDSLELVGMDETFFEKNPFALSGGQKRRVAIASILSMKPEVLVLDEPTAGLDPLTRDFVLNNIKEINETTNTTVIFISHSMEEICNFAHRVVIMHGGKLQICDKPENVFNNFSKIKEIDLKLPKIAELFLLLNEKNPKVPLNIITLKQAEQFFIKNLKK